MTVHDDDALKNEYPRLFAPTNWPWGPQQVVFERRVELPPHELIANVNLVPRVGERWLIIRVSGEGWDLPGGALEPGETMIDAVQRELQEEAGARLESFALVGAWRCRSLAPAPFRPHQPFPLSYRVVGVGDVTVEGRPTNPPGGEDVAEVAAVSLDEAVRRFEEQGRPELGELYRLASTI